MLNIYSLRSFCLVFLLIISDSIVKSVQAQSVPNPISQPNILHLKKETPLTPALSNSNRYPVKLRVKKFVFQGNTVFSEQQLEAVVTPFTGREITFADMLEARAAVTQLYVDHGYITSGAFLPVTENQAIQIQQGIVTIEIIEGKLEEIKISGAQRLQAYVRSRLEKATSPVLNHDRLLKALQILQLDPLIEKISASLSQGDQLGQSILNVRVKAHQPIKIEAFVDNSRSPAIGSFQRGLLLSHANLFGLGDNLSLGYRNTDGSNAFEASYSIPINSNGGTIQFGYTSVSSNVVERPFSELDIISDARAYDLTIRQPLLQQKRENSTKEFALGITASRQETDSELLDTPYPLSRGADFRGRTRISAVRFFQDWVTKGNQEVIFARSQFNLGIGAFDATINNSEPDSRFFAWQGQAAWLHRFGDTSLLLRTDLQLASRPLVPLFQFGLGGASTVRGYRQDALLADNGFLFSAEVRIPVWTQQTSQFLVIPFFDVGTAWNNDNANKLTNTSNSGTLASLGLGVQYQIGKHFQARLDWGIPLVPLENSKSDSWQEKGLYFSVHYQPF